MTGLSILLGLILLGAAVCLVLGLLSPDGRHVTEGGRDWQALVVCFAVAGLLCFAMLLLFGAPSW